MKHSPDDLKLDKEEEEGASKEKETEFHDKLDKMVHKTFGKRKEEESMKEHKEETELFDYLLEYLVAEGYADTNKAALVIMANMSEEWRQSIVEANAGPGTPVKFDPKMGVVPNLGAGRVKNVRPKGTAALPGV
jgi:hypothetical protein